MFDSWFIVKMMSSSKVVDEVITERFKSVNKHDGILHFHVSCLTMMRMRAVSQRWSKPWLFDFLRL